MTCRHCALPILPDQETDDDFPDLHASCAPNHFAEVAAQRAEDWWDACRGEETIRALD